MPTGSERSQQNDFASRTYALKVYAGQDALAALPVELRRQGVRRALVVCGRTVHEQSTLTGRIAALLGDGLAGIFPGISEGAPSHSIEAAAKMG
ncbi:MAG: iron-containing alcohol dehydrogenase, partial [bacterium]